MIAQRDDGILSAANTIWKLTQEEKIRQQCEAREDYRLRQLDVQYQIDTLNEQLEQQRNQQALTFIGQIRMFLGENYPLEKCAAMLMADPTVVKAVYAKIQEAPELDDPSILENLKGEGLI